MKHIKFFFKSLYQNTCILLEKQKWWFALLILLMSLVIAISPMLSSGYMSNVNGLFNSNVDTAIDKGFSDFAAELNEENNIIIDNGVLTGKGKFSPKNIIDDGHVEDPNATYYHKTKVTTEDGKEEIKSFVTLRVYVLNLDTVNNSKDQSLLESFLKTSVYKEDALKPGEPSVVQSSFVVFCKTTVHAALYRANGTSPTDRAVGSVSGKYTSDLFKEEFKFSNLKYKELNQDKGEASEAVVKNNFIDFFNETYTPVRIANTWVETGIYTGINAGVAFFAGLIFYFFARSKNSIKKYSFMESQQIAWIMCLSPAIVSAVLTVLIPSMGVFSFLLIISFRIMNAVTKINGKYQNQQNNEPVYKARQ